MKKKDFDYQIIPVDLDTAHFNLAVFTGLKNSLTVLEIGDINAELSIKINKSSEKPITLRNGDFYNFDGYFDTVYFTNIAVGQGIAKIGFGKDVTMHRSLRVTSDIIQQGLLAQVVTVQNAAPTQIPADPLDDRINWLMKVPAAGQTVFIGGAGVTAITGFPVAPGEAMPMGITQGVDVYGIVAAGTQDVNLLEGA